MNGVLVYLNGILLLESEDYTIDTSGHVLLFPYTVKPGAIIQILEYVAGFLIRRIAFKADGMYNPNERISYETFLPTT